MDNLYRPIHDILRRLLAGRSEPLPALRELASISHFDLFDTTTPDDLLARRLDIVRFGGLAQTDQIEQTVAFVLDRKTLPLVMNILTYDTKPSKKCNY